MFGRPISASLVVAGLLAGALPGVRAQAASVPVSQSINVGSCAQLLNGSEVDLKLFIGGGGAPYCDHAPAGAATLTFDLVDPGLRQVPVAAEVVQSGAPSRTVASEPAKVYPGGVIVLQLALDRPGGYTASILANGGRASFPISIGGLAGPGLADRLLTDRMMDALLVLLGIVLAVVALERSRSRRRRQRATRQPAPVPAGQGGAVPEHLQLPSNAASGSTVNGHGVERKKKLIED
jgi:hypothetical protein